MTTEANGKVLDFASFKSRKVLAADRRESLTEAFQFSAPESHSLSSGSPLEIAGFSQPKQEIDLHERIERIKSSIGRINSLMAELRKDKK
jgi:hypothetical protein